MPKKEIQQRRASVSGTAKASNWVVVRHAATSSLSQKADKRTSSFRSVSALDRPEVNHEVRRKEYSLYRHSGQVAGRVVKKK